MKALDAAVRARQWVKAAQIVEVVEDTEQAKQYFGKIAEHYASINELEVNKQITRPQGIMQFGYFREQSSFTSKPECTMMHLKCTTKQGVITMPQE